jgi:hypothetical protein
LERWIMKKSIKHVVPALTLAVLGLTFSPSYSLADANNGGSQAAASPTTQPTGSIQVTVTDNNGQPVQGARVDVITRASNAGQTGSIPGGSTISGTRYGTPGNATANDMVVGTANTDSNGIATLSGIPCVQNAYTLIARSSDGQMVGRATVIVKENQQGQPATETIKLQPNGSTNVNQNSLPNANAGFIGYGGHILLAAGGGGGSGAGGAGGGAGGSGAGAGGTGAGAGVGGSGTGAGDTGTGGTSIGLNGGAGAGAGVGGSGTGAGNAGTGGSSAGPNPGNGVGAGASGSGTGNGNINPGGAPGMNNPAVNNPSYNNPSNNAPGNNPANNSPNNTGPGGTNPGMSNPDINPNPGAPANVPGGSNAPGSANPGVNPGGSPSNNPGIAPGGSPSNPGH